MSKKKLTILICTLVVCAAAAVFLFIIYSAHSIISNPYSYAYDIERTQRENGSGASYKASDDNFVFISSVKYNGEDVTERFDHDALVELLADTKARRSGRANHYSKADVLWEISIVQHGPKHILLSRDSASQELNYWYITGGAQRYKIVDPAALKASLEQLMG